MIGGVTHLTIEADLGEGAQAGLAWGFEQQFRDDVALPAAFENIENIEPIEPIEPAESTGHSENTGYGEGAGHREGAGITLPLALLDGPRGIRLEVVQHPKPSGVRSAYTGLLRCRPPEHRRAPDADRTATRELLCRSGLLTDPVCAALTVPDGEAWFEAAAPERPDGFAGILCTVPDVPEEAAFWTRLAKVKWQHIAADGAWGQFPSPLPEARCDIVLAPYADDTDPGITQGHAMNDSGFPSIGVLSTAIDADCTKAVAAGAVLRAEPLTTTVGGKELRMALIGTPGGAPVELLSVVRTPRRPAVDAG